MFLNNAGKVGYLCVVKNNEILVLTKTSNVKHLKKINKKAGICASETGAVTKFLLDVDCAVCLDLVLVKRLREITAINLAKQKVKSINDVMEMNLKDITIRM